MTKTLLLSCLLIFLVSTTEEAIAQGAIALPKPGDFTASFGTNYDQQPRKNPKFYDRETGPTSFQLWVLPRWTLHAATNVFKSVDNIGSTRQTGFGDVVLGSSFQFLTNNGASRPNLIVDYSAKLANAPKRIGGTREVDHQLKASVSEALSARTYLQLDSGAYWIGQTNGGFSTRGVNAFVFRYGLGSPPEQIYKWFFNNEIDYNSSALRTPSEVYDSLAVIHKFTPVTSLKTGVKVGITPYTPRFGLFSSFTFDRRQ